MLEIKKDLNYYKKYSFFLREYLLKRISEIVDCYYHLLEKGKSRKETVYIIKKKFNICEKTIYNYLNLLKK